MTEIDPAEGMAPINLDAFIAEARRQLAREGSPGDRHLIYWRVIRLMQARFSRRPSILSPNLSSGAPSAPRSDSDVEAHPSLAPVPAAAPGRPRPSQTR